MSNIDDSKIEKQESILDSNTINSILGFAENDPEANNKNIPSTNLKNVFHPKVAKATVEKVKEDQIQTDNADANIQMRLDEMAKQLEQLKQGKDGVKVIKSSKKIVDFSKITEKDVYDMSIPIEAIVHEIPDASLIKLKDPNYIGRWVSIHPIMIGKRKAAGFTYVTKEDLDENLLMDLDLDENGHYKYIDVVAMKIPKAKYFGALRTNQIRAMTVVNPKKAHEVGKAVAENELSKGFDPDDPGKKSYGRDFNDAKAQNKMEVYI